MCLSLKDFTKLCKVVFWRKEEELRKPQIHLGRRMDSRERGLLLIRA
jgi:hypothetical protein